MILVNDWYQKNRNWMFVYPSKPWGLKEPPRPLAFAARLWKKTRHWFSSGRRIGVMDGEKPKFSEGWNWGKKESVMVLVQKHSKASTSHITWWDFYKWMRFKTPPWICADYHKISCGCVFFPTRVDFIIYKPLPKKAVVGIRKLRIPCQLSYSFPELSEVGTALAFGVFLSASSAAAVAAAEAGAAGAEVGAVKSATRESLY